MKTPHTSLAKLSPPRLPKIVERQRLFKELDRAKDCPITWITAPPGMGKTTLAASYIKARKLRCLWYQVDEGDADPATLFHYLGLAVTKVAPRYKLPLPHLTPEFLPGLFIFTRRFFEELYQRMKTPAILVLDNFHVLEHAESIHELFKIALEITPKDFQVLIMSRLPPPPPFARFLVGRVIHIIEEGSLRLTPEETAALIALKHKTPEKVVAPNQAIQLHDMTQGWLAGAILSLEHQSPLSADFEQAHLPLEFVFDYLAEEVMNTLSRDTQNVLLRLAYAPSFTTTMAEELTQNAQAPSLVHHLFRRRYFIEQRGGSPPAYQFHPMFKLFLQNLAETRFSPDNLLKLKRHTAALLATTQQVEEALTLFLQVHTYRDAMTLLLHQAPSLLAQGRGYQLEVWIQQFPEDFLTQHPWLLFWYGQSQRMHNLQEAEQWFTKAFHGFERTQDQDGQLAAWCALVETIHLAWSDWNRLNPWIEKLPHLIQTIPDFPTSPLHAQVAFNMFSLLSLYFSDSSSLPQWKLYTDNMLKTYPTLLAQLPASYWLPLLPIVQGKTQQATTILSQMKTGIPQDTLTPLAQLSMWYIEAHVAWQTGNLNQAEQYIDQAIAYGRKTGCLVQEIPFTFLRIWVKWSNYSFSESLTILSNFSHQIPQMPSPFASHYLLLNGGIHFLQGDVQNANKYVSNFMNSHAIPFIVSDGYSHGWAAQIAYAQGDFDTANTYLQYVLQLGQAKDNYHFLIFGLGTRALWALDQEDEPTARTCLAEGLAAVRRQGLLFFHYWPKPKFGLLCAKALEWNIEVEFVQNLVRKFGLIPEHPPFTNPNWPWAVKISTLGRFALEVEGNPLTFGRKAPQVLMTFLKALIALGGVDVPETTLSDLLWPDADGDLAHQTFATTLHRLRKRLGSENTIILNNGKVSLNPKLCWTDVGAFEQQGDQAKKEKKKAHKKQVPLQCEQALSWYKGPFLPDDLDALWTHPLRERLRGRFIRELSRFCDSLSELGQSEQAVSLFTHAVEYEPLAEPLYRGLAETLRSLNRDAEAQSVEDQFRNLARHSLGVEVTKPTLRLLSNLSRKS